MKKVIFFGEGRERIGEVEAFDGRVQACDPKLSFMSGWSGVRVAQYCAQKGWTWKTLTYSAEAAKRVIDVRGKRRHPTDLSVHVPTGASARKRRRK